MWALANSVSRRACVTSCREKPLYTYNKISESVCIKKYEFIGDSEGDHRHLGEIKKKFYRELCSRWNLKDNRIFNRHKSVTWQKTLVQGLANDGAQADHPPFD